MEHDALWALMALAGVYFFPSTIASLRKLKNTGSILVLNLFLGWTMLGWVAALVWAVAGTAAKVEETV